MTNNKTLQKAYSLSDITFAGFGYIVGLIFTLPFIIKYAKGNTWLAFVLGGVISILTGLSYAKLNLDLPSNDAEYSWITNALPQKKTEKHKTLNTKELKNLLDSYLRSNGSWYCYECRSCFKYC